MAGKRLCCAERHKVACGRRLHEAPAGRARVVLKRRNQEELVQLDSRLVDDILDPSCPKLETLGEL